MAIGTVKFFNTAKGFGFITPEDGGKDIFVHKKSLELAGIANLSQGQRLSFETVQDAKGAVQASSLKPHQEERTPIAVTKGRSGSSLEDKAFGRPRRQNLSREKSSTPLDLDQRVDQAQLQRNLKEWQRSYDRYCELARNARDDVVECQSYWQHAEHFIRMINGSAS
jgi:CspA family cold shock protein